MPLTDAEELELLSLLELEAFEADGRRLARYFPDDGPLRRALYPKHLAFFAAGASFPLRLFCSANRVGKTEGFGCELVYHLTGDYPPWWEGRRFTMPLYAWAAGDTNAKTQEIIQAKLFGTGDSRQRDRLGTGLIPRETLAGWTPRPGVPGAIQSARIAHRAGGESTLTLKSFEQGVESFQGNEVHVIWLDELAPQAILAECIIRTTPTPWFAGGLVAWTVTPLEGLTDAILDFLPEGQFPDGPQTPPRFVINCTWDEVPHLSEATKTQLKASIPPYQLDARSRGIPVLGAGVVYPVPEDTYVLDPIDVPPHWRRAFALDVGWERTAALWGAYDPETGVWYCYSEHYRAHAEPSIHAAAVRGRGEWIPGCIDPAARGRGQRDGAQLMVDYQALGLDLTAANNAVEAGIYRVWEGLSTGRIKIFTNLQHLRKELRLYRRDAKGRIVKEQDHLVDCLRYLMMSGGELAQAVPPAAGHEDFRPAAAAWAPRQSWMG